MQIIDISGRALLVSLSISTLGNTRKDARITKETNEAHGADETAGRYSKHLLPPETLEPINQHSTAWRKWHRLQTLPWMDDGARIITTQNYADYTEGTRERRRKFETLRDEFLAVYPQLVADAPQRLNGMHNPADYLPMEIVKSKFGVKTTFTPLPLAGDFRAQLQTDEIEQLKTDYEQAMASAVESAKADVVRRLKEPLAHMAEILRKKDGKGTRIDSGLVENLRQAVLLIPQLQLEQDERFSELLKSADSLADTDVDGLRKSAVMRRDTADEAERIVAKLDGYFGGASDKEN